VGVVLFASAPSVDEASGANKVIVFPAETSVAVAVGVKLSVFVAEDLPVGDVDVPVLMLEASLVEKLLGTYYCCPPVQSRNPILGAISAKAMRS